MLVDSYSESIHWKVLPNVEIFDLPYKFFEPILKISLHDIVVLWVILCLLVATLALGETCFEVCIAAWTY